MRNHRIETGLVAVAAGFLAWGIGRTCFSGAAQPPYAVLLPLASLLVLTGSNIPLRSKRFAAISLAGCGIFIGLQIVAVVVGATHQRPLPVWQIIRAFSFSLSLGVTGWLQLRAPDSPTDSAKYTMAVAAAANWILYGAAVVLVICLIASRQWWISIFFLPIMLVRPTLLRTLGWIGGESAQARQARRLRRQVDWLERRAMPPSEPPPVTPADKD